MNEIKTWFEKLFIDEASPALKRHSGGGGASVLPLYEGAFEELIAPTIGLAYTLAPNLKYYIASGMGTATVTDIVIADTYKGLPVTEIGYSAFSNSEITSVYIPDSITKIGASAFADSINLKTVRLPEIFTPVGSNPFSRCTSLITNIKDNIKYLGPDNNPYMYLLGPVSGALSYVIDDSCEIIGPQAFYGFRSMKSIDISDNVEYIYDSAFYDCEGLTNIKMPANLKYIQVPFSDCSGLEVIDFSDCLMVPTLDTGLYHYGCYKISKIIVPDTLYDDWTKAENWTQYTDKIIKVSEYTEE